MFAGARFCAHCGAESSRQVVEDGEKPLKCPRCREDLQSLKLGSTIARECAQCGGLWLDPDSLQTLANAGEENAAVVSVLAARVPLAASAPDVVRYIPCPRCDKLMNRSNFARSSGVILDVCKSHGVWLDRGELQRVLDFIASGGLALARAREREQLVEEQRRLTALQNHAPGGGAMAYTPASMHRIPSADAAPSSLFDRLLRDALGVLQ